MDKAQEKLKQKKHLAKRKSNSGRKRVLINILFAACILGAACLIFIMRSILSDSGDNHHAVEETQKIVVTQAQQYQAAEDVYLEQHTGTAHFNISNDASNTVSIQVTIALKGGEILYTSQLLKPGTALEEIQIDSDLQKGEYDIEISVDSYSLDQDEMVSGVIYDRKLFVE